MLNSTWDFVKRHRGKIATVATVVGGVYATKKVFDHQGYQASDLIKQFSNKGNDVDPMLQSRKNFIFDSHQQSCDKQVKETVQDLLDHLNSRFNTDELIRRLQSDEKIETREKVEIWNQIKLRTFARIFSLAYMHSIVLLALKLQKSILCRETIKNFEKSNEQPTGITNYVYSFFTEPANTNPRLFTDPKAQQIFLNCIHYLTTHGLDSLFDQIESSANELIENVSLAKEFSASELKNLLEKLKFRIECTVGQCNFADFVVPISKSNFSSSEYNSAHLEELLSKLTTSLQSTRSQAVLSGFIQRYINETVDFIENELESVKPTAIAKLLPILNSSLAKISSTSYDSVLQQNIASTELYQLCQMVFTS